MPKLLLENGLSPKYIAEKINSQAEGDLSIKVHGVCSLEESEEKMLSFYRGSSLQTLTETLNSTSASLILVPKNLEVVSIPEGKAIIKVPEPFHAFISLIPLFFAKDKSDYGHSTNAFIHPSAEIDPSAEIGPFSYIGAEVRIEKNVVIHPHVTIYPRVRVGAGSIIHSGASIREDTQIEADVIIQNGAIIGADGFGYVPDATRGLIPVPQIGNVVLSTRSEVGANTCIDRATLGATKIGSGTKVDNLVQIGHNTQVGSHTIICGQSAIAGSSKIGNQVVLGGNVGVADHTVIADGCRFGAFSGLHGTYETKGDYAGNPAMPARTYRRVVACLPKLPELFRKGSKTTTE